jgi:hypothetical protein
MSKRELLSWLLIGALTVTLIAAAKPIVDARNALFQPAGAAATMAMH